MQLRFLFIDDNSSNQSILKKNMESISATCDVEIQLTLKDSNEQAFLLRELEDRSIVSPFDIIFQDNDLGSGKMNGHEAIREMRERGYKGNVILHSAGYTESYLDEAKKIGFTSVLSKPCTKVLYVKEIEKILQVELKPRLIRTSSAPVGIPLKKLKKVSPFYSPQGLQGIVRNLEKLNLTGNPPLSGNSLVKSDSTEVEVKLLPSSSSEKIEEYNSKLSDAAAIDRFRNRQAVTTPKVAVEPDEEPGSAYKNN